MRQEPIEIALSGAPGRRSANIANTRDRIDANGDIQVVDEAFARFDGADSTTPRAAAGNRRLLKQTLVHDLAAQLEAIDCQRERLARLLDNVKTDAIAD
jgi:hypothetical protein